MAVSRLCAVLVTEEVLEVAATPAVRFLTVDR